MSVEHHAPGIEELLRAVRAEADAAVWARARERIESGARVEPPGQLWAWLSRPVAVAAAFAVLAVTIGVGAVVLPRQATVASAASASLVETLLEGSSADAGTIPAHPSAVPSDTGGAS